MEPPKCRLNELCQRRGLPPPSYATKPDGLGGFSSAASVSGSPGPFAGRGRGKRDAEHAAAGAALRTLGAELGPLAWRALAEDAPGGSDLEARIERLEARMAALEVGAADAAAMCGMPEACLPPPPRPPVATGGRGGSACDRELHGRIAAFLAARPNAPAKDMKPLADGDKRRVNNELYRCMLHGGFVTCSGSTPPTWSLSKFP